MSRLIKHDAKSPTIIPAEDLEGKSAVAICACGLSQNKPYCDGSHTATNDEADGATYRYDGDVKDGARTQA